MKRIKTLLSVFLKIVSLLIIFLLIVASFSYILCPVYRFEEPAPFSGNIIHNPYAGASFSNWKKAALHTHTTASDGKNRPDEVIKAYTHYGYDVVAITDHSGITHPPKNQLFAEIPSYEHGINISMFHSVNIGARKIIPRDYFLINSLSHKYDKLKMMNESSDVVLLAHPHKTRWLTRNDLKYLNNYKYIEISLSQTHGKQAFLDAALSAGHPVYVAATDDCHNINDQSHFARSAIFVEADADNYNSVISALAEGRSFAITIPDLKDSKYKLYRNLRLPLLENLFVRNDSVTCTFSEAGIIRTYGQNGTLLDSALNSFSVSVPFTDTDTYLRFTSEFSDGVIIYTNPVYRTTRNSFGNINQASIHYPLTFVQSVAISALLVILLRLFILILMKLFKGRVTAWIYRKRIVTLLKPGAGY